MCLQGESFTPRGAASGRSTHRPNGPVPHHGFTGNWISSNVPQHVLAHILAAQFKSVVLVAVGTPLGMLAADGLAVFLGERRAAKVRVKRIRWVAASLFFAFGGAALWSAVHGG